ncbi:accessory gene regulator ArgB-like protein [Maledivibacter halophilus]|uniref:Accessory gene regulator B n=1 Tax=Maledivibacter halophilus TaxID=36842 RepID=A0A1T5MLL6_9FIRM|nr:accessory gene regulator B family protein [Maledivibacter halophilus]SKC89086.1 accessory gene regulator B [Maledivibacter halophilus]
MVDRICRIVTQQLVQKNIIEFEDYDIYMYGLQMFIASIFKGIGIFAIFYGLGWLKEAIVFIMAFGILRINAGGYHSSTYFRCFILTIITMIISIVLAIFIIPYTFMILPILVISILLVLQYAPVDTPNKPLSNEEYLVYRKRSIIVVLLESLIILIIFIIKKDFLIYCNIAAMAILNEALTLTPFVTKSVYRGRQFLEKEVKTNEKERFITK